MNDKVNRKRRGRETEFRNWGRFKSSDSMRAQVGREPNGFQFRRYLPTPDEIAHYDTSTEPIEEKELSWEEVIKMIAKVYGVDENDERAVFDAMIRAANRPAYEDD